MGHTETAQRLRPWLDYAAAIPWNEPLPRPWEVSPEVALDVVLKADRLLPGGSLMVNELAHATVKSRSRFPRTRLADWYARKRPTHSDMWFYELFWSVRTSLSWFAAFGTRPIAKYSGRTDRRVAVMMPPELESVAAETPALCADGTVSFAENLAWGSFKRAILGVEASRLKHCPVCNRVYYAVRRNKGACDEHLGLARVWRKRGKDPEYNASRRFRKKAGLKGVRGKERRELELLSRALPSEENKECAAYFVAIQRDGLISETNRGVRHRRKIGPSKHVAREVLPEGAKHRSFRKRLKNTRRSE